MDQIEYSNSQKSFARKYRFLLIILAVLLFLLGLAWLNKATIELHYAVFKHNNFKPGDSVYADDSYFKPKYAEDVIIYQSIGPKSSSPFTNKSYMANLGLKIYGSTLVKRKSAKIGTYLGYEIGKDNHGLQMVYFIIKPDEDALHKEDVLFVPDAYKIPNGFVKNNNNLYMEAIFTSEVESRNIAKYYK